MQGVRRVKIVGAENHPQRPGNVIVVVAEAGRQWFQKLRTGVGRVADKKAEELLNDEPRGGRLFQQNIHDILARKVAGLAQQALASLVVLSLIEPEMFAADFPAGEGTRGLFDVCFAVIANPQAEQLHHFAGKILVGARLVVSGGVKPDQHGRVLGRTGQQRSKVAQSMFAKQPMLPGHHRGVVHFDGAGGKMTMPEQGHLFQQRVRTFRHRVQPPGGQMIQSPQPQQAAECLFRLFVVGN
jgi:hypothetical protein